MAPKPPPGTFRLYPYANPPLTAGKYTVTGEVTGLPGTVEPLQSAVDITAPRFALPPDQVLSTFPPASARGAFTSRLPQIVVRRRTLPWERSEFTAGGQRLSELTPEQRRTTTPRPWLALVLIAEGEGSLLSDVPVADCTTSGTTLADPTDIDVPKTTCLEVPKSVVTAVFPALEDLTSMVHVREVDLNDTELALGDDDGWMAVVLCNRLPQANTGYTACLINVEGQYDELPTNPPVAAAYDPTVRVVDIERLGVAIADYALSADAEVIGTTTYPLAPEEAPIEAPIESVRRDASPTAAPAAAEAIDQVRAHASRASRAAASTGSGWGAAVATPPAAAAAATYSTKTTATVELAALGSGLSVYLPWYLVERTLRFPVLASWSFYCTDAGDFQYLAQNVNSRLLGHIPTGPETPDGEPLPPGTTPPGLPAEPPSARPLPLVAATGHVATAHQTRRGQETTAWFRSPLVPEPVDRPGPRPDGRYPLAHHADQLRRVSPDGSEDLSYAAAFEIGRLLALSRPGVVTALNQWRRQRYAAATTAALSEHLAALAPTVLGELFRLADPIVDRDWVTAELPGPPPPEDPRAAAGVGRRFVRGLLSAFGDEPTDLAPARPLADPGFSVDEPAAVFAKGRDARLARGLALPDESGLAARAARGRGTGEVTDRLWGSPVAAAPRDAEADVAAARAALEELAGRLADATERSIRRRRKGS
jgi:hypothetical protein